MNHLYALIVFHKQHEIPIMELIANKANTERVISEIKSFVFKGGYAIYPTIFILLRSFCFRKLRI
jgi:hypothetical protein